MSRARIDCLIDGRADDRLPADDRGLLYGDALFETMAFLNGRCPLWSRHWTRLRHGAGVLGIPLPEETLVESECRRLLAGDERAVIRLTLTRGSGGRAYWPAPECRPRRILQRRDWPPGIEQQHRSGLRVVRSSIRLEGSPTLGGLKHGNRLEQVLAARECLERGADEAILLDTDGCLAEAIASNLLLLIDGECLAPDSRAAVAGVGLDWLLDQPEAGVRKARLEASDLDRAESIMVINSVAGIRPVRELDGRALEIGGLCRRFQALWTQRLDPPCDD
ncbi:aminodeoxychorismate lyase [Wenzhouxiangella marina]|uniref:Aminodeoxychorismate lyase n=1 Tax=Wenzhouxiangella marina TaxID=1579979 RepID=A0A0K0XW95_9GAMM|nr:aminodeoxychorismate lyase [Wenzhouxiangella marina]AKS41945.1 Aminodeoxychorismate lyase [Wenzhouxiangella marina]MBB6086288.1 4-amino-4-deoxychorismate lyase [Wenzhouxiangella marina]